MQPSWGGAENGGIVKGPEEGDGYVWCYDVEYCAPTGKRTLMNYPIFKSPYSGLTIDFRKGVWNKGNYVTTPIKFINISYS